MKNVSVGLILFFLAMSSTVSFASGSANDLVTVGKHYLKVNDLEIAISYFDQAITERPWEVSGYLERAKALTMRGECEKAMRDYFQAITINMDAVEQYIEDTEFDTGDVYPCYQGFR
jgi:Tfp pilus assembly protein PilF